MKRKPEELVKYYVFPHGLSDQEKKQAEAEMKEVRMRLLREMTDAQRMYAELIRLRLRTEQYVNEEAYQEEKSFGSFLREYLTLIRKSQKDFSEDIGLHPTKSLSENHPLACKWSSMEPGFAIFSPRSPATKLKNGLARTQI